MLGFRRLIVRHNVVRTLYETGLRTAGAYTGNPYRHGHIGTKQTVTPDHLDIGNLQVIPQSVLVPDVSSPVANVRIRCPTEKHLFTIIPRTYNVLKDGNVLSQHSIFKMSAATFICFNTFNRFQSKLLRLCENKLFDVKKNYTLQFTFSDFHIRHCYCKQQWLSIQLEPQKSQ